jgi:Apea-like HEPN
MKMRGIVAGSGTIKSENWNPWLQIVEPFIKKARPFGHVELRPEEESELQEWFKRVSDLKNGKHVWLRGALRRFSRALEKDDASDRLVDLVIVLESVLTDREERGETTERIALRAALLGNGEVDGRVSIQSAVRKIYKARSDIVHGGVPKVAELIEASRRSRAHRSHGLAKCPALERLCGLYEKGLV